MATADVGTTVLAIDVTLYGFVIAYYVFSRSLQEQEKARIDKKEVSGDAQRDAIGNALWANYEARTILIDVFVIGCTAMVFASVVGALAFIVGLDVFASWEAVLLAILFSAVAVWVGAACFLNLRYNLRRFEEHRGVRSRGWQRWRTILRAAVPEESKGAEPRGRA